MTAINFPDSSESPFTAPNGIIYTWNTAGYWEAGPVIENFLKLDASNGPITGSLSFSQDVTVDGTLNTTSILNTAGDVILNTSSGASGTTFIGRSGIGTGNLIPTGTNSAAIGVTSGAAPLSVFGRALNQTTLYGTSWANMVYGGADDQALMTMTANNDNPNNWKDHLGFVQYSALSGAFTNIAALRTQVTTSGIKLFLNGATAGFEITGRSTSGSNRATVMTFNARTGEVEDPAGTIDTKGQGSNAEIIISSTNGNSPVSATLTDSRNVTSATALPDPTTAIKALTPQLLTLSSGVTVASFPATHTRTHVSDIVFGTDGATREDGSDDLVAVDHSKLVPFLTKALQELITRVETLEAAP